MFCDRIGMDLKRFFFLNLVCMNIKNVKLNWNRNGKNGYLYMYFLFDILFVFYIVYVTFKFVLG